MPFPSLDAFKLLTVKQESAEPWLVRRGVSIYSRLTEIEVDRTETRSTNAHRLEVTIVSECPAWGGQHRNMFPDADAEIKRMLYQSIRLDLFKDTIAEINDIRQRLSTLSMNNICRGDLEKLDKIQAMLAELSNRLVR